MYACMHASCMSNACIIYACMYVQAFVHACMHMYACIYAACTCACMYNTSVQVCMYACTKLSLYICMHTYTCIYAYACSSLACRRRPATFWLHVACCMLHVACCMPWTGPIVMAVQSSARLLCTLMIACGCVR